MPRGEWLWRFSKMPKSVKVLLESLVRRSHPAYTKEHVEQLSKWVS